MNFDFDKISLKPIRIVNLDMCCQTKWVFLEAIELN